MSVTKQTSTSMIFYRSVAYAPVKDEPHKHTINIANPHFNQSVSIVVDDREINESERSKLRAFQQTAGGIAQILGQEHDVHTWEVRALTPMTAQ